VAVPQLVYSPLVVGVLLVLFLSAESVAAQSRDTRTWYQAYADAQRKIQAKDYNGALADLDVAAKSGAPQPGRNVPFYGDVYRDYNPDYYRGVALAALGRADEADKAFERVRNAKLIAAKDPLYAEFTRLTASVRDTIAKTNAGVSTKSPPPTGPLPGSNTGTAPPAGVDPTGVVPQIPNTSARTSSGIETGKLPASGSPTFPYAGPPNTGGTNPSTAANPPARGTGSDPPRGTTTTPTSRAKKDPRPPATNPVSDTLRERTALVSYFSGDYGAAAAALRSIAATNVATPRTYLYLACSEAALVLTGQLPREALNDARMRVARVGDTTALARDLALISPRIRQELGLPR
jgi:hypothetical protein